MKSESDIGPIVQIKTEKMDEPDDGISIEVDTDTSDNDDEDDCFSDCITFTSSIIRGRKNTMDDEFGKQCDKIFIHCKYFKIFFLFQFSDCMNSWGCGIWVRF